MAGDLILSPDELKTITGGYTRQAEQLRVLHARGFYRAAILHGRLILERSHYDAVTRGSVTGTSEPPRPKLKQNPQKAHA